MHGLGLIYVFIYDIGPKPTKVIRELLKVRRDLDEASALRVLENKPAFVLQTDNESVAVRLSTRLSQAGAGCDIADFKTRRRRAKQAETPRLLPTGTFCGGRSDLSNYMYSSCLLHLGEASLVEEREKLGASLAFRLLYSPSFHNTVCLRIWLADWYPCQISATVCPGWHGGWEHSSRRFRTLTSGIWEELCFLFESVFAEKDSPSMSKARNAMGLDGASWILERVTPELHDAFHCWGRVPKSLRQLTSKCLGQLPRDWDIPPIY